MGDPKKQKKKYFSPMHPWQGGRIEKENQIVKSYGFKNKTEIWKSGSVLKRFKKQIKELIPLTTKQAEKEKKEIMERMFKLGLVEKISKLEDALALDASAVFERRLQTQVLKRNLARTPRQARQFIVHGHVAVNNKKMNVPSYLVSRDEENKISFLHSSSFSKPDHPEINIKKEVSVQAKKTDEKKIEKDKSIEGKEVKK